MSHIFVRRHTHTHTPRVAYSFCAVATALFACRRVGSAFGSARFARTVSFFDLFASAPARERNVCVCGPYYIIYSMRSRCISPFPVWRVSDANQKQKKTKTPDCDHTQSEPRKLTNATNQHTHTHKKSNAVKLTRAPLCVCDFSWFSFYFMS